MKDATIPTHSIEIKDIRVITSGEMKRGRTDFARIHELAEDIKKNGLINPVMVTRENGTYTLVGGERRLRAYMLLWTQAPSDEKHKWTHIDARVREELTDLQQKEIELSENIVRCDLNELEKMELIRQIHELKQRQHGTAYGKGWTTEDTAQKVGLHKSHVGRSIRIAEAVKAKPELKEKFVGKPINAMLRELDRMETSERLTRLVDSGQLKVDHSLVLGDARIELAKIPPSSVHLCLTDPPFGITQLTEMEGQRREETMSYLADMKPADNLNVHEAVDLMKHTLDELTRVLVDGGHFYMFLCYDVYPAIVAHLLLRQDKLDFQRELLTWDKGEPTAAFMGYRYAPCSEPILFGWKKDPTHPKGYGRKLNGPGQTLLRYKPLATKVHPFEKPLPLLKFLISQSTHVGERVIDPFGGSASTLIAARELGRSAWGCEVEKDHWTLAQGRLNKKENV